MLLYVVTICAAVIFCALSAPLYALPRVGAGTVSGSAPYALSGHACPLYGGGLGLRVCIPSPGSLHLVALSAAPVCPPPVGAGVVSGSALPALSGSPCPRSGGGLGLCVRIPSPGSLHLGALSAALYALPQSGRVLSRGLPCLPSAARPAPALNH